MPEISIGEKLRCNVLRPVELPTVVCVSETSTHVVLDDSPKMSEEIRSALSRSNQRPSTQSIGGTEGYSLKERRAVDGKDYVFSMDEQGRHSNYSFRIVGDKLVNNADGSILASVDLSYWRKDDAGYTRDDKTGATELSKMTFLSGSEKGEFSLKLSDKKGRTSGDGQLTGSYDAATKTLVLPGGMVLKDVIIELGLRKDEVIVGVTKDSVTQAEVMQFKQTPPAPPEVFPPPVVLRPATPPVVTPAVDPPPAPALKLPVLPPKTGPLNGETPKVEPAVVPPKVEPVVVPPTKAAELSPLIVAKRGELQTEFRLEVLKRVDQLKKDREATMQVVSDCWTAVRDKTPSFILETQNRNEENLARTTTKFTFDGVKLTAVADNKPYYTPTVTQAEHDRFVKVLLEISQKYQKTDAELVAGREPGKEQAKIEVPPLKPESPTESPRVPAPERPQAEIRSALEAKVKQYFDEYSSISHRQRNGNVEQRKTTDPRTGAERPYWRAENSSHIFYVWDPKIEVRIDQCQADGKLHIVWSKAGENQFTPVGGFVEKDGQVSGRYRWVTDKAGFRTQNRFLDDLEKIEAEVYGKK